MLLDGLSSTTQTATGILGAVATHFRHYQWYACNAVILSVAIWILQQRGKQLRTTKLRGPPSDSFLFGSDKHILDAEDSGAVYESWSQEYGAVYAVPSLLGNKKIVLCDPKAIIHFYAKESWTYIRSPFLKKSLVLFFGKGLGDADGENYRRQRKFLSPAFGNAAIRRLTPIFYDSAYKTKVAWDALIESSGEDGTLIEVQKWINHISLDTIGLAGFSHNFGALEGKHVCVTEILDSFSPIHGSSAFIQGFHFLMEIFPFLLQLPSTRTRQFQKINAALRDISDMLFNRTQKEMKSGVLDAKEEKSIIESLISGTNSDSGHHLTNEEVASLVRLSVFAGYESTSITLTWTLLELSRNPDIQAKLRNELLEHDLDPTYDMLTTGLRYLDAVVHEVLRLHPPLADITRVAVEDDVIPLSKPVYTTSGEMIDRLNIAKGSLVTLPMDCINRSTALWGDDAKLFRPSRWLEDADGRDGIPDKAKEIRGYRHILTFSDGARICLGRHFAVTEIKAVLTVLVKNYVFEPRDGIDTRYGIHRGVLPRPKIEGEEGGKLPLRVRPYAV